MKKYFHLSIEITVVIVLLCLISDALFHTHYMGETVFQPFPHLLLFLSLASDLFLWYKVREERRESGSCTTHCMPKKTALDVGILFVLACLIGVTFALLFESVV